MSHGRKSVSVDEYAALGELYEAACDISKPDSRLHYALISVDMVRGAPRWKRGQTERMLTYTERWRKWRQNESDRQVRKEPDSEREGMTPAQRDLAVKLAAHPAFKWGAGMLAIGPSGELIRVLGVGFGVDDNGSMVGDAIAESLLNTGDVPDLSDPPTCGCLLAMLPCGWVLTYPVGGQRAVVTVGHHPTAAPDIGSAVALALLSTWSE